MIPKGSYQEVTIWGVEGNDFAVWLEQELNVRGWKPADLARASKLPGATISRILNGDRNAGADVALAISKGLNLSADFVFRKAGLLPDVSGSEHDPAFQEILDLMKNLSPEERREVVNFALFRYQQKKGE